VKLTPIDPVAKRVYDRIMKCETDDEAKLYAAIIAGAGLQYDMITHHDIIQDRVDEVVQKRAERLKKNLARETVLRAKNGEDVSELIQKSVDISKDFDFTPSQRRAYASQQDRDFRGQFRTMHHRISYSGKTKPVSAAQGNRLGIAPTPERMSQQDRLAYQEAYMQVQNALRPFISLPANEGKLLLTYQTKHGVQHTSVSDLPVVEAGNPQPAIDARHFAQGGRLIGASVAVNPRAEQQMGDINVQGAAFDLAGALGDNAGTLASNAFERNDAGRFKGADRLGSFAGDWNAQKPEEIGNPRAKVYRRLHLGSRLLDSAIGPLVPNRMRLAIQSADFVGQYGSEADKVIGPHADRAAYRYRGVERKPDPVLQATVSGYSRAFDNPESARNALIYGYNKEYVSRNGIQVEHQASPVIEYFRGRLADKDLVRLQAQSGVIPPSEGMIIDRNGKVVSQAVGYGEDWYLPFNLKTLSRVKGGEYIRTRAWGGPTTEDIYAGLITGAKSVTVVSHNGVYTVDFDESFRGSRRYNDKAARMVGRYGHLLDAVKSQEVTLAGIPEDRLVELKAEAAKRYNPKLDRKKFEDRLEELKTEERIDPQMSQARKQQFAIEFLDDRAQALPGKHGSDHVPSWTDFAQSYVDRQVASSQIHHPTYPGAPEWDEEAARLQASAAVATPMQVIQVAGLQPQWEKYAEQKQVEYVAEQKPLELNGPGYDKALKALREQFPYYIANVSYQPFQPNRSDIGYVKPRFNRPERALAGYYDTTIGGVGAQLTREGKQTGKITADQIRWQNGGPQGGKFQQRGGPKKPYEDSGRTQPIVPGGTPSDLDQQIKGQNAVEAAHDYVRNNLPAGVTTDHVRGAGFPLLGGSKDELLAAYQDNPAKTRERLLQEVDRLASNPVMQGLTIPTEVRNNLRNPNAADIGGKYSDFAGLSNPEKTYDFGSEYAIGRQPEEYLDTYRRQMGHLGINADIGNPDSQDLKEALDETYKKDVETLKRSQGIGVDPAFTDELKQRIKNNIKARQAARRWREAEKAEEERIRLDEQRAAFGFGSPMIMQVNQPQGGINTPQARAQHRMPSPQELHQQIPGMPGWPPPGFPQQRS